MILEIYLAGMVLERKLQAEFLLLQIKTWNYNGNKFSKKLKLSNHLVRLDNIATTNQSLNQFNAIPNVKSLFRFKTGILFSSQCIKYLCPVILLLYILYNNVFYVNVINLHYFFNIYILYIFFKFTFSCCICCFMAIALFLSLQRLF